MVTLCLAFGLYYYYFLLVCMCMMLRTQGFVVYWALHYSVMSLVGIVLLLTMAVITKFCPKSRKTLLSVLTELNLIWNRINSIFYFSNEKKFDYQLNGQVLVKYIALSSFFFLQNGWQHHRNPSQRGGLKFPGRNSRLFTIL